MKYVKTMILILIVIRRSSQRLLASEAIPTSPLSECIVHILKEYFINFTKISIKYSNQQSNVVSEILRNIDLPTQINGYEGFDQRIPNDVNVITDESTNISEFLNYNEWTAATQFLVTATKSQTLQQKMIDVFQQFWAENIVNVLMLVADQSDVNIYTFIPFNAQDCAVGKPVLLTKWTSGQMNPKDVFKKKRVSNLNGCTLNASLINTPPSILFPNQDSKKGTNTVLGIEGLILMEISKQLNLSWNFAEPKDGKMWGRVKPIPHGAVGEVFLKKSHVACGRIAYSLDRHKYLDMSAPISCERECVSWAVPVGAKKSQLIWISLFKSGFHNNLWYLIFTTFTCVTIAFRILSKNPASDQYLCNENSKAIIYAYRSSLGSAVKAPKTSILRVLFIFWLWYSFVILSVYQALMGSKLTVPPRQSNINTYKDLLESDLHITGLLTRFKLVTDGQEGNEIDSIRKRFEATNFNPKETIDKIIYDKNIAALWPSTAFMYNVILHPKAKGLVHFMKQCANEFYPTMLLQKHCPFTHRVNRIIRALFEAGIICKWRRQYVYDVPQIESTVQRLSLNRMIGSFVILGAGLWSAMVVFLAEHVFFWYSSKKFNLSAIFKSVKKRPKLNER